MRGIGRLVAGIALVAAISGVAAFAHLLGSVPAPSVSIAALPPAPDRPLVVDAAPWSPATPAGAQRPTPGKALQIGSRPFIQIPATRLVTPAKPTSAQAGGGHGPAATPVVKQTRVTTPTPAATPATTPVAAAPQPTPAATPATTPVAAPAAAPTVTTLSATVAAAAAVTTTASHTGTPSTGDDKRHRTIRRFVRTGDDNGGPTLLTVTPVQAATPAPVVGLKPPSVDPPSTGTTTTAAPVAAPVVTTTTTSAATPTVTSPTVSPTVSSTTGYHFDGQGPHVGWHGDGNDDHSH